MSPSGSSLVLTLQDQFILKPDTAQRCWGLLNRTVVCRGLCLFQASCSGPHSHPSIKAPRWDRPGYRGLHDSVSQLIWLFFQSLYDSPLPLCGAKIATFQIESATVIITSWSQEMCALDFWSYSQEILTPNSCALRRSIFFRSARHIQWSLFL